jgi:ribosomal protein S18 acetylase RimI-like enzyme
MITNFVGEKEVTAYLRDFLRRLVTLNPLPNLWCPVTPSGEKLLRRILELVKVDHPNLVDSVSVLPIQLDRATRKIAFRRGSPSKDIPGKSVLILDGAIHSGSTMARAVEKVVDYGAAEVCTYSLMLKCDSAFIPTMWGFMIDKTDRAFFLLEEIPNHRLSAHHEAPPPLVHIQRLDAEQRKLGRVVCGVKSLDRVTWGDRWFDMAAGEQDKSCYLLLKKKAVLGYLTVHHTNRRFMVVDEIALHKKYHGKGYGGILIRFADTLARQSDSVAIQLHAIKEQVKFYRHYGYHQVAEEPLNLEGEEYQLMRRPVLRSGRTISNR